MTYEQYWYGDPLMVRAFYAADKLRQEQKDADAWLNGIYVLKALDATVCNMFRKGKKLAEYPNMPITHKETEQEKQAKAEREAEAERVRLVNYLNGVIAARSNKENNETKND